MTNEIFPEFPKAANSVPISLVTKTEAKIYTSDTAVSCATCVGACCLKGVEMDLTDQEVDFLQTSGTDVVQVRAPVHKRFRKTQPGKYMLMTDCGFLTENESGQKICSIHEDPNRPKICNDFPVGSYYCRELRDKNSVQPGERERFLSWLTITS
jgi:Fe-S-cluster containining protein